MVVLMGMFKNNLLNYRMSKILKKYATGNNPALNEEKGIRNNNNNYTIVYA